MRKNDNISTAPPADDVYIALVTTLFVADKTYYFAIGSVLIVCCKFFVDTGNPAFLVSAGLALILGTARMFVIRCFSRAGSTPMTRETARHWQNIFVLVSLSFAANTGMLVFGTLAYDAYLPHNMLAEAIACLHSCGIAARNSGRPRVATLQIVAMLVPLTAGSLWRLESSYLVLALLNLFFLASLIELIRSLYRTRLSLLEAMGEKTMLAASLAANNNILAHMASHDPLTGLYNRTAFNDRMEQDLAGLQEGASLVLLCLDLDRFKAVNDSHGHAAGDAVLCDVAQRISSILDKTMLLARIGGDEFAILTQDTDNAATVHLCKRIIAAVSEPYWLGDVRADIGVSIGVARTEDRSMRSRDLLKAGDAALYDAKANGRGTVKLFSPDRVTAISPKVQMRWARN